MLNGTTLFNFIKSSGKIEIAVGRAFSCSAVAYFKPICAPSASFKSLIVTNPSLTNTEPNGIPCDLLSANAISSCSSFIKFSSIKISPSLFVLGAFTFEISAFGLPSSPYSSSADELSFCNVSSSLFIISSSLSVLSKSSSLSSSSGNVSISLSYSSSSSSSSSYSSSDERILSSVMSKSSSILKSSSVISRFVSSSKSIKFDSTLFFITGGSSPP